MAQRHKANRKITLEVPWELLQRAQRASGAGVTETVRRGLTIVAAQGAYEELLRLRGSLKGPGDWRMLKDDRW